MKNIAKNQKLLAQLPSLTFENYHHAYLIEEESATTLPNTSNSKDKQKDAKFKQASGVPLYEFLYNPETITLSMPINYTETAIPYTSVQPQSYSNGGNITWTIPDLILDCHYEKKSIQPLLDALIALRNPEKEEGLILRPKTLYFKWGAGRFGPCVLTNLDSTITNWINGFPTRARVSITLKEIPPNNNTPALRTTRNTNVAPTIDGVSKLQKTLSDKQIQDGITVVRKYLNSPAGKLLPKSAQDAIKDPKSSIQINKDTGSVAILNSKGARVLTIGIYNGDQFQPNTTFSVANPIKQILTGGN